jgi:hypothetical protein
MTEQLVVVDKKMESLKCLLLPISVDLSEEKAMWEKFREECDPSSTWLTSFEDWLLSLGATEREMSVSSIVKMSQNGWHGKIKSIP